MGNFVFRFFSYFFTGFYKNKSKMKKIIALLSCLTFLLISCSKEEVVPEIKNTSSGLLSSMVVNYINGHTNENGQTEVKLNFYYEGNKILRYEYPACGYKFVFTYTDDLITKVERIDLTTGRVFEKYFYEYDDQNRLVLELIEDHNGVIILRTSFSYNFDGSITQNFGYRFYSYHVNNNLIRRSDVVGENTFDNKSNLFNGILGFDKLYAVCGLRIGYLRFLEKNNFGKNNILTEQEGSNLRTYTYIYNDNNKPISKHGSEFNVKYIYY